MTAYPWLVCWLIFKFWKQGGSVAAALTTELCVAAPADCTVTQVTPATHMHSSCEAAIETALCNIFSVTLKPIDARAFVRAVRQRFEIRLHEAFSWGPAGMFRSDVPTSMKTRRIPLDEKVR